MARKTIQNDLGFGSDSFLDIVSNVVGILIILVIVVGVRVRQHVPVLLLSDAATDDLSGLKGRVAALEREDEESRKKAAELARQTIARQQETDELSARIAQREAQLAQHRAALDEQARQVDGLRREFAVAQAYLDQLRLELATARTAEPAAVTIESYPTPISRMVEGKEVHFQLKGGRIVAIPLDELLERLRSSAVQQLWKLKDQHQASDTVGPLGGFRMRYVMERVDLPGDGVSGMRGGSYAQLSQWTLVPIQGQLGETIDQALRDNSDFYQALGKLNPRGTTVTVWTYPDSFEEFRAVRKELYRLGFAAAGRPLPEGHPIGGSPSGSKSAAQ
jgi:TolA-binding protein